MKHPLFVGGCPGLKFLTDAGCPGLAFETWGFRGGIG